MGFEGRHVFMYPRVTQIAPTAHAVSAASVSARPDALAQPAVGPWSPALAPGMTLR